MSNRPLARLWGYLFRDPDPARRLTRRPARTRLHVLPLEDRTTPTGLVANVLFDPVTPEDDGMAGVYLSLAGTVTDPVTVGFEVGGTAVSGTDYTYTGGFTRTFYPNDADHGVWFTLLDDASWAPDRTITVTLLPGEGYTVGEDTTGTITITDDDPTAADDTAATAEDEAVTLTPVGNDTDPQADTLTVSAVTQGAHGAVTFYESSVTYTPDANWHGTDTFTYTTTDGNGGYAVATVTITVNPVNDDPVANDDTLPAHDNEEVTGDVLANDTDADGDELTVTLLGDGPAHGTLTLAEDGSFSYTPDADWYGTDSFEYQVDDGHGGTSTATVTITRPSPQNDYASTDVNTAVTIDVLGNDTASDGGGTVTLTGDFTAEHGTVAIVSGQAVYTPDTDFVGVDVVTYTITDGNGGTATGLAGVTVNGTGSIGGMVWDDTNGDGTIDTGEGGVAGFGVYLLQDGTVVNTTTTDAGGVYNFAHLAAGDYTVSFTAPAGQGFSTPQSVAVTLTTHTQQNTGTNAGLTTPTASGSIGGTTWQDDDEDGTQDAGESALSAVRVNLYQSGGAAPVATTTTSTSGAYLFSGLAAGNYTVEFVAPEGLKSPTAGPSIAVVLGAGQQSTGKDIGFVSAQVGTGISINQVPVNGSTVTPSGAFLVGTQRTFTSITVFAVEVKGGKLHREVITTQPGNNVWSKAVSGLPKGDYVVWAVLTVSDNTGKTYTYSSNAVGATIAAGNPAGAGSTIQWDLTNNANKPQVNNMGLFSGILTQTVQNNDPNATVTTNRAVFLAPKDGGQIIQATVKEQVGQAGVFVATYNPVPKGNYYVYAVLTVTTKIGENSKTETYVSQLADVTAP